MRYGWARITGVFALSGLYVFGGAAAVACSDSGRDFADPDALGGSGADTGEPNGGGGNAAPTAGTASNTGGGSGKTGEGGSGGVPAEPGDECVGDAECYDELACNGDEQCDNGYCVAGKAPCSNPDAEHCAVECTEGDGGPSCAVVAADHDNDTHGDVLCSVAQAAGDDCDDGDETIFAGAEELCDGKDNDCDDDADENTPRWYLDCDGDGFSATTDGSVVSCTAPAPDTCGGAWTSVRPIDNSNTDCVDSAPGVYPGNNIGWQTEAIPNTSSFDWNCDGVETHHFGDNGQAYPVFKENVSASANCTKVGVPGANSCQGVTGWTGDYPECGDTAEWTDCAPYNASTNPNCTGRTKTSETEECK